MKEALMFDTSIWIDFFNNAGNEKVLLLTRYIENDYLRELCPVIIQEILQGIKDNKSFNKVKDALLSFNIIEIDPVKAAVGAAKIYRKLRKKGITIRKSNDCLIAFYALESNIKIVHKDRDFDLIMENI
jgi:predicted nucleic acid-binding protein